MHSQKTSAGQVEVSRSGPDAQRGYAWSVTFVDVTGDVAELGVVSSLTGNGATVTVTTVVDGNELGGTFGLRTANGFATEQLPFDVSAAEVEAALNLVGSMDSAVGEVEVSKSDEVTTEGGTSFVVSFKTAAGDVPPLLAETFNLTGTGASILVHELVKGSETRGDKLAIGFAAPQECSESQVTTGTCGEEVQYYEVQTSVTVSFVGSSLTTETVDVDRKVQIVRIGALAFVDQDYESPAVSGHFQLAYDGHPTSALSASVSAATMRHSLEALSGVGAVNVTRDYARRFSKMTGSCSATTGFPTITCANLNASTAPQRSDLISVGGTWYRVGDTFDPANEATVIPLASASDPRIETTYLGETDTALALYGWSGGYEWRIDFIGNPTPKMLTSPAHNLVPDTSSVSVRLLDCDSCVYADGLDAFQLRYVRVRAVSSLGPGPWSDVESAKPARVPDPPSQFSVEVTSGTSVRLYWHPPATNSGDILGYSIQWDSDYYFEDAITDDATCVSIGFGDCFMEGAAIQGTPPFEFTVNDLTTNVTYFFRIAARNELFDSLDASDGAKWTEVLSARPTNVAPLLPRNGVLYLAGRNKLQLRFEPPTSDGGDNITAYAVEYDTETTFSTGSLGYFNITVETAESSRLYENGPIVVAIGNLEPGVLYYARVAAVNSVGLSPWSVAHQPIAPASAPDAPAVVHVTSVASQSGSPITSLDVSWEPPANATGDGGNDITSYIVEWYTAEAVCEQQQIRLTWDQGTTPGSNAGFVLQFSNGKESSEHGITTSKLVYDVTASRIRDALMNLGYHGSVPYDSEFTAGPLDVTRTSTQNFHGYSWSVTFADCEPGGLNEGDLVPMNAPLDSVSDSLELDIIEILPGSRSLGNAEEQIVRIYGTKSSVNDTQMAVLGYWRLGFDGSEYSIYMPSDASAKEVEESLELLSTVNQVKVSVSSYEPSSDQLGLEWRITFSTNVGDQPTLYYDSTYLYSTVPGGSASIEIPWSRQCC